MITIPKKVEYSVILLSYLSKKDETPISLTEAAKKLYLPYRFLGQLCADLKTGGILESKEGRMGGYVLAQGWREKSVYDLVEALGENKRLVKCLDGDDQCARAANCEIRGLWGKIEDNFVNELKRVKLTDL